MIIHIWMHWFWITTAYFKGIPYFTLPTISLSCISIAEAGLLTSIPYNESSQLGHDPNITAEEEVEEEGDITHPPTTELFSSSSSSSSSPQEDETTTTTTTTTMKPRTDFSDTDDTYTGGNMDVFKKLTKYSNFKYGKVKQKGGRGGGGGGGSEVPDLTTTTTVESVTSEEGRENVSTEVEVIKNDTLVIENKVEETGAFTTVETFAVRNRVAAATSAQNYEVEPSEMNAGSITGITLGILVVFSLFGAVSFVLYRRRYLNKPQVLHDKCSNLDSSGYIDETSLRENSEEMYSLDNDSFLNSLEAMTIQNYWTESVKHTKL